MNQEIARIRQMLTHIFAGSPWHGHPVMEILKGISAAQAAKHPLAGSHSIWEIVRHMSSWRHFTWQKLQENGTYDILSPAEDWPPVMQVDEPSWEKDRQELIECQEKLLSAIEMIDDTLLEQVVPGREYNFYVLLHGIIQHDLYHAGQIALLKKYV